MSQPFMDIEWDFIAECWVTRHLRNPVSCVVCHLAPAVCKQCVRCSDCCDLCFYTVVDVRHCDTPQSEPIQQL